MVVTIIGVKKVDYTKPDGKRVEGVELVYTFESSRYQGVNADRQFVNKSIVHDRMSGTIPQPGDQIEFMYGRSRDGHAYVNGWIMK